jgi:glycosidase
MKRHQIDHQAKSAYAYSIDKETIHIKLKTFKDIANQVELIYGDPFMWGVNEETKEFEWMRESQHSHQLTKEASTSSNDYYFTEIKAPTKRMKYAFLINGQYLYGSRDLIDLKKYPEEQYNLFNYFNFPYIIDVDMYKAPKWVQETVWYSIFPDRFSNKDNRQPNLIPWESEKEYKNNQFYGGNLKGITDKLPYIKDMGFDGLYMTPIFLSPSAHKYDTIDYFEIDPSFGTKNDLKELVNEAHKLGIKVMLDAVFNHTSVDHPFFIDVIKKGKDSLYYNSFYIKKTPITKTKTTKHGGHVDFKLDYETFAFSPKMPKTNTEDSLMREHLLNVSRYWIEHFDIDGWRLDVSNEISHDFWRSFRKVVKKTKQDTFILGENWDNSMPWLQGDQFDAVMNYEFMYPIWSYFGTNIKQTTYTGKDLKNAINQTIFSYPKNVIVNMFNLVDSHDTERIAEVCEGNRDLLKLVYLFQFSLPGAPSIYYGGEIGLRGKHDPDNRRCMIWDKQRQDTKLQSFIKKLISIYHQEKAFQSPTITWLLTTNDVLIYQKENITFVINKSENAHTVKIDQVIKGTDLLTNTKTTLINQFTVSPYQALIIKA